MKKYFIVVVVIFLSCNERNYKRITYSLGETIITRFDINGFSYFLPGDKQSLDTSNGFILSRHTRGTDIMDAYLIFNQDNTVDLVKVAGDFTKYGNDRFLKLVTFSENARFIKWETNMQLNPVNIIRVDDALNIEKQFNDTLRTNVKTIYHNNSNVSTSQVLE